MGKPIQLTLGRSTVEFDRTNCGIFLYWHGRLIEVGLAVILYLIIAHTHTFESYCQGQYLVHSKTVRFQFLAIGRLEHRMFGPSVWSTINCVECIFQLGLVVYYRQ